ncbi:MAG: heme exporter protein CcmD [Legionellaceae bacterium]|nr:heme exporter protein CcmD [Legionellaceae bacterium]
MNTWLHWFDMGGYARYVWPAYAAVFFVFMAHFFHVKRQKKRVFQVLKRWSKSL